MRETARNRVRTVLHQPNAFETPSILLTTPHTTPRIQIPFTSSRSLFVSPVATVPIPFAGRKPSRSRPERAGQTERSHDTRQNRDTSRRTHQKNATKTFQPTASKHLRLRLNTQTQRPSKGFDEQTHIQTDLGLNHEIEKQGQRKQKKQGGERGERKIERRQRKEFTPKPEPRHG